MFKHTLALIGLSALTLSANAALYDRGNGLIYDDTKDITWLLDANYAKTSGYTVSGARGGVHSNSDNIQADGQMGWDAAMAWAAQLEYGGFDDWRLPSAGNTPTAGYNVTTGELGLMFYVYLSNLGEEDVNGDLRESGFGITSSSFNDSVSGSSMSILNLKNYAYWLREENADNAWFFSTQAGSQQLASAKRFSFYSWAVRTGDVTPPVPVPAAVWLSSTALLSLVGAKRRYR